MSLFGPEHLLTLLSLGVVAAVLCAVVRRSIRDGTGRAARVLCWLLAASLVANEALEQVIALLRGRWSLTELLPLHLCDIGMAVTALALIFAGRALSAGQAASLSLRCSEYEHRAPRFRGRQLFELAYYWGLAGTIQALLTPAIEERFPDPACLRFFVTHGGVVIAVLVMVFGLGLRPRRGSVWRVWGVTAVLAMPVGLVNWLLGANYMYLCGPPPRASLYDYLGPWPWSLAVMGAAALLLFWICYLPVRLSRFFR